MPIAWGGRLTPTGTAFAVFMFAAAAAVVVARPWNRLFTVSALATCPQVLILAVEHAGDAPTGPLAVGAACAAVLLAAGIGLQLRSEGGLEGYPASIVIAAGVLASLSAAILVAGSTAEGSALLGVAAVDAVLAGLFFPRPRYNDLSALLATIALAIGAVAVADLLSGSSLALAWAAEAAVLAWLATRIGDVRYQLGSLAYLLLAVGHALVIDTPLRHLFVERAHPAAGVAAPIAVSVAAAVFAERFELGGGRIETKFERGHAAVSAVWGVLALLLLYLGLTRRLSLRLAGFALFGVTLAKIFLYDLATLSPVARAMSFLAVGAVLLLGGFFYQRLSADAVDGREATGR
jgi:hypothetical protein